MVVALTKINRTFCEYRGQTRERLKHQDIPFVSMGLMGDIPLFRVGLTCTPLQSVYLKAISCNF
jgi:hypothetical protein